MRRLHTKSIRANIPSSSCTRVGATRTTRPTTTMPMILPNRMDFTMTYHCDRGTACRAPTYAMHPHTLRLLPSYCTNPNQSRKRNVNRPMANDIRAITVNPNDAPKPTMMKTIPTHESPLRAPLCSLEKKK
jgi:hypothetical protein